MKRFTSTRTGALHPEGALCLHPRRLLVAFTLFLCLFVTRGTAASSTDLAGHLRRHLATKGLRPYLSVTLQPNGMARTHLIVVAPSSVSASPRAFLQSLVADLKGSVLSRFAPGSDFAEGSFFQVVSEAAIHRSAPGGQSLGRVADRILALMAELRLKLSHFGIEREAPGLVRLTLVVAGDDRDAQGRWELKSDLRRRMGALVSGTLPGDRLSSTSTIVVVEAQSTREALAAPGRYAPSITSLRPSKRIRLSLRSPTGKRFVERIEVDDQSALEIIETGKVSPALARKIAMQAGIPKEAIEDGSVLVVTAPSEVIKNPVVSVLSRAGWTTKERLLPRETLQMKAKLIRSLRSASKQPIAPEKIEIVDMPFNRVKVRMQLPFKPTAPKAAQELLRRTTELVEAILEEKGQKPVDGSVIELPNTPAGWPRLRIFEGDRWVSEQEREAILEARKRQKPTKKRPPFSRGLALIDLERPTPVPERRVIASLGFGQRSLGIEYFSNMRSMDLDKTFVGITFGMTDKLTLTLLAPTVIVGAVPVVNLFSDVIPGAGGSFRINDLGNWQTLHLAYRWPSRGRWERGAGLYLSSLGNTHREMLLPEDFDKAVSFYFTGERALSDRLRLVLNLRHTFLATETPQGAPDTSRMAFGLGLDFALGKRFSAQAALRMTSFGDENIGILGTLLYTGPWADFGGRYLLRPDLALEASVLGLGKTDYKESRILLSHVVWK